MLIEILEDERKVPVMMKLKANVVLELLSRAGYAPIKQMGNGLVSGLRPVYHFFQMMQMRAIEPLSLKKAQRLPVYFSSIFHLKFIIFSHSRFN